MGIRCLSMADVIMMVLSAMFWSDGWSGNRLRSGMKPVRDIERRVVVWRKTKFTDDFYGVPRVCFMHAVCTLKSH